MSTRLSIRFDLTFREGGSELQNAQIPVLQEYSIEGGVTLPLFQFPALDQTGMVRHGFTTRLGGVSKGMFSTLNVSFSRGDDAEDVKENYRRLASALHVDSGSFVFSHQTHTTNVARVGKADVCGGRLGEHRFSDVDGLVTDEAGVTLVTFHADCVPLFFVDMAHHAIGLSHSGWRGTVHRMGRATLERMREEFGTDASDVVCAIGPSICGACYEVSEDVAKEFQSEFGGASVGFLQEKGGGKYLLDLWRANEAVLLEAGIKKERLSVTEVCTCCNQKLLFSHRATGGKRGNLAAALALRRA